MADSNENNDEGKPDPTKTPEGDGAKPDPDGDDGDAEKWKALARKHEKNAGKLQAELDKIKTSNQTEQEKAIETAKAEARAEARAELQAEMVETALEAIASDKLADPSFVRLIDKDDRETFLDKDGKIDRKAIGAAVDALVKKHPNLAKGGKPAPLKGGSGDGSRSTGDSMNDNIRRLAGRNV